MTETTSVQWLTQEAYDRLKNEFEYLSGEGRVEIARKIEEARLEGDLRENGEYESARNRQDYLRLRIATLRKRLGVISMMNVDRLPRDRAGFGSRVDLYDLDREEEMTYSLVMSEDANAEMGKISTSSPIGKSLLNKCVGDEVEVRTPNGVRRFEVIGLRTIHDIDPLEPDAPA